MQDRNKPLVWGQAARRWTSVNQSGEASNRSNFAQSRGRGSSRFSNQRGSSYRKPEGFQRTTYYQPKYFERGRGTQNKGGNSGRLYSRRPTQVQSYQQVQREDKVEKLQWGPRTDNGNQDVGFESKRSLPSTQLEGKGSFSMNPFRGQASPSKPVLGAPLMWGGGNKRTGSGIGNSVQDMDIDEVQPNLEAQASFTFAPRIQPMHEEMIPPENQIRPGTALSHVEENQQVSPKKPLKQSTGNVQIRDWQLPRVENNNIQRKDWQLPREEKRTNEVITDNNDKDDEEQYSVPSWMFLSNAWTAATESESGGGVAKETDTVWSPRKPMAAVSKDAVMGDGLDKTEDDVWIQKLQQRSNSSTQGIVGTCELMCPEEEFKERQRLGDTRALERSDPARPESFSAELAVKKFKRTVDGGAAHLLRTRFALRQTMRHLRGLLDSSENLAQTAQFLEDAYRAVRQDLSIQGIRSTFAIRLCEEMTRFMIMIHHELCEVQASVHNKDSFNAHLNIEQLNKTLFTLMSMYREHRNLGNAPVSTEPEFVCYDILIKIAAHGKFNYNPNRIYHVLNDLPPQLLQTPEIKFAMDARRTVQQQDYVGFFKLLQKGTYLQACMLHLYLDQMRNSAVEMMLAAMRVQNKPVRLPLEDFRNTLMFDDKEQAKEYSREHGMSFDQSGQFVVLNNFSVGESVERMRSGIISQKAPESPSSVLIGQKPQKTSQRAVQPHKQPQQQQQQQRGPYSGHFSQDQLHHTTRHHPAPTKINASPLQLSPIAAQNVADAQHPVSNFGKTISQPIQNLFQFTGKTDSGKLPQQKQKMQREDSSLNRIKASISGFWNTVRQQQPLIASGFDSDQNLKSQQVVVDVDNHNTSVSSLFQHTNEVQKSGTSTPGKRARMDNNQDENTGQDENVSLVTDKNLNSSSEHRKKIVRRFGWWPEYVDDSSGDDAEIIRQRKLIRKKRARDRWQRAYGKVTEKIRQDQYWKRVFEKADQPASIHPSNQIRITEKDKDPFGFSQVLQHEREIKRAKLSESPAEDESQYSNQLQNGAMVDQIQLYQADSSTPDGKQMQQLSQQRKQPVLDMSNGIQATSKRLPQRVQLSQNDIDPFGYSAKVQQESTENKQKAQLKYSCISVSFWKRNKKTKVLPKLKNTHINGIKQKVIKDNIVIQNVSEFPLQQETIGNIYSPSLGKDKIVRDFVHNEKKLEQKQKLFQPSLNQQDWDQVLNQIGESQQAQQQQQLQQQLLQQRQLQQQPLGKFNNSVQDRDFFIPAVPGLKDRLKMYSQKKVKND